MLEKNPNIIKHADLNLPLSDACLQMAEHVEIRENTIQLPVNLVFGDVEF